MATPRLAPWRRAWLFPVTYLAHIAEEYWAGERFYHWLSRVAGASLTAESFLALNAIFLAVMTTAVIVAIAARSSFILLTLACIILINAVLHAGGSVVTGSYSPGLVSALVLWVPLALASFRDVRDRVSPGQTLAAVITAVAAHMAVSMFALGIL